jgi:signal transduction histidine kinase
VAGPWPQGERHVNPARVDAPADATPARLGWPPCERCMNGPIGAARPPTLPLVDAVASLTTAGALAAAIVAGVAWRRASISSKWARQQASAAAAAREELAGASEERRVRDVILATMPAGVLLIGREGDIAFANGAVARLLAREPASLDAVLPLALRTAILGSRERSEPASVHVETGVPTRWLRGTITPAADGATLVVVEDVTRQRRLESVRRDFVANASHELKTPAATIQATAETLRRAADEDPEAIPRFASQLEREAVRLSRIVADLLDLSRLESGSSLEDSVSLAATTREEVQRLEGSAQASGVTLEVEAQEVRSVMGSQRDLALLVRNLVDNAIRYSHRGGNVRVEVGASGDEVSIRVSDTGVGIPTRDIPRIFERFYRVDRARSRETGGTGLGLAIVKHVVENHAGRIEIESELGRGTTVSVTFPASSST